MSLSDAFGLAGIVVSALFGIWGVYLALRRTKYPAGLTFVREQSVALLDDFATKLPNLSVIYKDTPINKSVVLISGHLVNDGNVDITPEMVERPLTCRLPGECHWLEFKITTTAPDLHVESALADSSEVEIKLGLFRRDESFAFQALALLDEEHAIKKPTAFAEKLEWSHRIAGLGNVKTTLMPQPEMRTKGASIRRKIAFVFLTALYAFWGFSQATGIGPLGPQPSIAHEFLHNGSKSALQLSANRDGTTTIRDMDTGEEQKADLADFSKTGTFVPYRVDLRKPEKSAIFSGLFLILTAGIMLFMAFATDYKRYRIRRMVSASTKEA